MLSKLRGVADRAMKLNLQRNRFTTHTLKTLEDRWTTLKVSGYLSLGRLLVLLPSVKASVQEAHRRLSTPPPPQSNRHFTILMVVFLLSSGQYPSSDMGRSLAQQQYPPPQYPPQQPHYPPQQPQYPPQQQQQYPNAPGLGLGSQLFFLFFSSFICE
jgi:hypothetical protein